MGERERVRERLAGGNRTTSTVSTATTQALWKEKWGETIATHSLVLTLSPTLFVRSL